MANDIALPRAPEALPGPLRFAALAGMGTALYGVYWDDAWHTDKGRDSLLSPPHIALYAGVAVALASLTAWVVLHRGVGWRRHTTTASGIGIIGAAVVLGSAPVDEWWHRAFGRDAVLWSPPHLLALVGTIALATSFLLIDSTAARSGRFAAVTQGAAAAPTIGAWLVLVLEYDSDVPQFSPRWYLPVLATALSAGALTAQIAARKFRYPAVTAGVVYTLAMITVILGLRMGGLSTPIIPVVIPALFVADVTARRGNHGFRRTTLFTLAVLAVYVPYLSLAPGAVAVTATDVAIGLPLAAVGVALTIAGFDRTSRWTMPPLRPAATIAAAAIGVTITIVLAVPSTTQAHDPGQGDEVAGVTLCASVTERTIFVEAVSTGAPLTARPLELVARRAGRTLHSPLALDNGKWSGTIDVDSDGRWFVYVTGEETDGTNDMVEAWIPVQIGSQELATKGTKLYRTRASTTPPVQIAAGIAVGSLAAIVALTTAGFVRQRSDRQLPDR